MLQNREVLKKEKQLDRFVIVPGLGKHTLERTDKKMQQREHTPRVETTASLTSPPASFSTWQVYSPASSLVLSSISRMQDFSVVVMLHL